MTQRGSGESDLVFVGAGIMSATLAVINGTPEAQGHS